MNLSIVTTLYCSENSVDEFYRRMVHTADRLTDNYEIIFVSDGSPDTSLQKAVALHEHDFRVKVAELSRNFGHHNAILAGLSLVQGERVFLLDVDLEEQPELLEKFWGEMEQSHADVVFGVQEKRKGPFFAYWAGVIFYKIFNLLSEIKIPENLCTIRLMSSRYVQALLLLKETSLYLAGNATWVGFEQREVPIEKMLRKQSAYSFRKKVKMFCDAVISFSTYPLWLSIVLGFVFSLCSGCWGLVYLIKRSGVQDTLMVSYTSLLISVWFVGGLILFFVGLNGLYLSKTFMEVKGRPQFIIRHIYEKK